MEGVAPSVIQTILGTPAGGDLQVPHWLAVRSCMQSSSTILFPTHSVATARSTAILLAHPLTFLDALHENQNLAIGQAVTRRTRSRSRSPVVAGSARPHRAARHDPDVCDGGAGLGPLVGRELDRLPGIVVRDSGFDGRSDVVLFETTRASRSAIIDLGLAEELFVEVGRTLRAEGDRSGWIAGRLWRPERVQRALSVWAEGGPAARWDHDVPGDRPGPAGAFLPAHRSAPPADEGDPARPARWRVEDPAQIEVWVSEYAQGRFVAGLRLSDERMRQRGGRVLEREGALRPTVAGGGVLLVPQLPRAVVPRSLRLRERFRIRLLGTATTIWVLDQTA